MKKKIENFWYHYKGIVFAAAFAVILIAFGVNSCQKREEPDVKMVYFSNHFLSEDTSDRLEAALSEAGKLKDVDSSGTVSFYLEELVSTFDVDEPMDESTMSKLQTTFFAGSHTVLLIHKYGLEDYDGCFEDISKRAEGTEDVFVSPENNAVTGISVEGNAFLEELGINTQDLYVAMRQRSKKEIEKKEADSYFEVGYDIMDYILSFNEVKQ